VVWSAVLMCCFVAILAIWLLVLHVVCTCPISVQGVLCSRVRALSQMPSD
jgi:hypothetical protein